MILLVLVLSRYYAFDVVLLLSFAWHPYSGFWTLKLFIGAGTTVIITHLGDHALHVLGPTGTAGHIVDLQAQMGANLVCHQSLTDMVQLLYPGPDLALKCCIFVLLLLYILCDNFIFTRWFFIQPQINLMLFGMRWNGGGRMETADNPLFWTIFPRRVQ